MSKRLTSQDFESLRIRRAAENPRYTRVAKRLRELFWDSDCNDTNLRLYQRLEDEVIREGEPVYRAIKAVAASAASARNPVRYFAASITRRLREQGYMQDQQEDLGL